MLNSVFNLSRLQVVGIPVGVELLVEIRNGEVRERERWGLKMVSNSFLLLLVRRLLLVAMHLFLVASR